MYHCIFALLLIVNVLQINHPLPPSPGPQAPLTYPDQFLGKDGKDGDNSRDQVFKKGLKLTKKLQLDNSTHTTEHWLRADHTSHQHLQHTLVGPRHRQLQESPPLVC